MDKQTLQQYIESKKNAWSPSTQRSVHAKLRVALEMVAEGPEALYTKGIQMYAPYSLKALFVQAGSFYAYCNPGAVNPFKAYLKTNAQLFKNCYVKEEVGITFEEAKASIEAMPSPARELAHFMLTSGLRSEEALSYDGTGFVIGKGLKRRKVFAVSDYPFNHGMTYSMLHKALAKVGLKAHTLRKLYATQLVEVGLQAADLMRIMGWSSIETSAIYLQAKSDVNLNNLLKERFT